jgi:hypothetical protein
MTDKTTEKTPLWDDILRITDELELKIHLGTMDARDRWKELQPRVAELEKQIARKGERAGEVISQEVSAVAKALRQLRDDLIGPRKP